MKDDEQTPLVQKLILAVLALILVSLVVLIAQNRRKPAVISSQDVLPPEPVQLEELSRPVTPIATNGTARLARQAAPREAPPRVTTELARETSPAHVPEPLTPPTPVSPTSQVALVNPVRPEPVDFVLRADAPGSSAEICGRVRLEGTPPREVPVHLNETCRRLNEGPITTRHYVVGPERGLANVLVYIKEGLQRYYSRQPDAAAVLTASHCSFEPYVFGVQTGKPIVLVNGDNILHNFHATARNNPGFNLSMPLRGTKEKTFEKPELFVRIKCDVHPWEFAYAGVFEHPFFSVTDTNGVFCLPAGLPRGRYVLAAVHLRAGETIREIVVGDGAVTLVELALNVRR